MKWLGRYSGSTKMQPNVSTNESLTSFVFRPEHVVRKSQPQTIHPSRLLPRRNRITQRLETSVCRSTDITETRIWEICATYFDPHAPKPAIGRGNGPASVTYAEALHFDADGIPYAEHANIVGWHDSPNTPDTEQKHFWMNQVQRIAPEFHYSPRPNW